MKTKQIAIILFFGIIHLNLFAQVPGKKTFEPFVAVDGETYTVGDSLKMGVGSNTDGSFNYIYVPPNILLGSERITYSSAASGIIFKLKHFSKVKSSGETLGVFTYVPEKKIDVGFMNAIVDINLALETGELESKNPSYGKNIITDSDKSVSDDKYDNLLKLKELYEAGVLTEDEFKKEKQEILNK